MDTVERKLMKKGRKLAKFARKHGFEYVHVGVMSPDKHCDQWFTDVTAHHKNGRCVSSSDFFESGELDE